MSGRTSRNRGLRNPGRSTGGKQQHVNRVTTEPALAGAASRQVGTEAMATAAAVPLRHWPRHPRTSWRGQWWVFLKTQGGPSDFRFSTS